MKILMIGNAHIDPVWLWPWQEGYQEVKATFRSALDRMEEHPDFVFTCACAEYYRWVEESDPAMFAEIRRRVGEGRWVLAGGMWIQPDMNTPSGESLARQLLLSQRYFRAKFGRAARFGYNVDSFGHSAAVPMLLREAGMDAYVWMRPGVHENAAVPEGPMWWEAPDGSRVRAYRIHGEYTGFREIPEKIGRMRAFSERLDGLPVMCFYGVGNHGGGPTRENLREIDAYIAAAPEGEEIRYASPEEYFRILEESCARLPVWKGELQHHASGCYSTHSAGKMLHRRAENALLRMERLGVLARALTGRAPQEALARQAWEHLLFNEFHDIMGGCCIESALADAERQLGAAIVAAEREENAALQAVSWRVDTLRGRPAVRSKSDYMLWTAEGLGTPVVVFNPHAFPAAGLVRVRKPLSRVEDCDGRAIPCQRVRAERTNGADKWDGVFTAAVPPLGYRTFWVWTEGEGDACENPLRAGETFLENEYLRAEFDPASGALIHLVEKASGRDALTGPAQARLYDISACDTWAHMVFRFDREVGRFAAPEFRLVESGPVRAALEVITRCGESTLRLMCALGREDRHLTVRAELDLREGLRMVKFCFPTRTDRTRAEIPFGALNRPASGDEEPCQRWCAAEGPEGGLAVCNDGKYSYSAPEGELRCTLANSSIFADHYGQEHRDADCRCMDLGRQTFRLALLPFAGETPLARLDRLAEELNMPMPWVVETYHAGPLPESGSLLGVPLPENVRLSAIKRAEDGRGSVAWLWETAGRACAGRLDLPGLGRAIDFALPPFGLKTIYLPDDTALPAREVLLTEWETDTQENGGGKNG